LHDNISYLFLCLFSVIACFGHIHNVIELFAMDYPYLNKSNLELDCSSFYWVSASNIYYGLWIWV